MSSGDLQSRQAWSIHRNGALTEVWVEHLLSARATIPPDIPVLIEALLLPQLPDLRGGDSLVITVVPLADGLGHLNAGGAWR